MDKTIEIRYCGGRMLIRLEKFFPTSADRLKKLFKVIRMDFNNGMNLLSDLHDYFLDAKENYTADKQAYEKETDRLKQLVSDLTKEIKEKKRANGVPYTKDGLKEARGRLKALKEQVKENERAAKEAIRNIEQIQRNNELLKDYVHNLK